MGHKVNPRAFRQNTTYRTPSRWFAAPQDYVAYLQTDIKIRDIIAKRFRDGGVARVEIDRSAGEVTIGIHSSKPGVIIGRGGVFIDELRKQIKTECFGSEKIKITVNIHEVKNPDINSEIVYQAIRDQLENRVPFRRAIKRGLEQVIRGGAKGCKISVSGRLNGADIARTETVSDGRLPLQSLRAKIDYAYGTAATVYGVIGIKVWIYTGDSFGNEVEEEKTEKKRKRRPQKRRRKKKYGAGLRKKTDSTEEKKAAAPKAESKEDKSETK